ncbi:MarR family transcriptional regulator [Rhodococcus sp. (in: high G+C Gram-positive bacteria)]|uniref:MarR family winged helix-turn-helix transcriptional regulator n=1 Tax=unclassified Rhodococcus (in: high G+C Gram-positive bacteria) TaxID=192944 RepID=UPI002AD8E192|nr:MarR family transcriptional regulator [Rhodococcus sp. (in: high G+C Gram-positive bacteria)]MDZ7930151.1 MarR family transcriptional regulator [Rhodococcus sp. (in: high G+C Gram-positive bacteria)]
MTGSGNSPSDEPDLAALIFRVVPRLGSLEAPVLRDAGLSMWEYAILTEVASGAAVSQKELSRRTKRDPTRLGKHLDELISRDLVYRERSRDQRQRTVGITPSGRLLLESVRVKIRMVEDDLLRTGLSESESTTFRELLARLANACEQ